MFLNYLKTSLRNIARNKVFSFINMLGLALGMAVFMLIAEYVALQWNTNRFHKNYSQLYKMLSKTKEGNGDYLPPGLAGQIPEKFPGVQSSIRVAEGIGDGVISYNDSSANIKSFREKDIFYADGNFLEVFSFPLISGRPSFQEPNTLALSQKMAFKLFGNTNAIGKSVTISNQFGNTVYTVNAIYQNKEQESDINPAVLLSFNTLNSAANRDGNDWADPSTLQAGFTNIYLLLKDGVTEKALAPQLTAWLHQLQPAQPDQQIALQPFKYLHLAPDFHYPYQTFGSLGLVTLLFSVAILILMIAWVNYINLSTAQALKRAKESGVRKVLGATRWQLAKQFMSETLLFTLISILLAFCFVQLLQPVFNSFTGKDLSMAVLNQGLFWPVVSGSIMGAAFLAGAYTAFVLSGYKPIHNLRSKWMPSSSGISLRKALVVFQFSISIVLIIATLVLYKQLQFMKNDQLGMNLNQLLVIKGAPVTVKGQAVLNNKFKDDLMHLAFVKKLSASNNVPGIGYNFSTAGITKQVPTPGDEKKNFSIFIADNHFFDTYGITFIQGQTFTEMDDGLGWSKAGKVILNEKAASLLGFERNANIIGKKIMWDKEYEIAGVIKDYHHLSKRMAIEPTIYLPSSSYGYFTIQTGPENMSEKLAMIGSLYKKYFNGNPFDYFFAKESYNNQFKDEQKLGGIFFAAATIAILIACLGLFGLSAFSAQQRIKEIGIRKVLGASVFNITTLLTLDFIKLVAIAMIVACPLAWWGTSKWLNDFVYRTALGWWIFAAAGGVAVFIALATIGAHAVKAAVANPVKSLRTE